MHRSLRIKLESPVIQYLVGVFINLLYLIILVSNHTSYKNIQLPEGIYSENLWKGTDVLTYVGPARNFVHYGIFGYETVPGYHRTIGYPLFLSILIALFGSDWLFSALFAHALIFALIYPAMSKVSNVLFNDNGDIAVFSFLFFIISGTYIAMVPMILTDLFFTVFFTLGLCFGLDSIIKRSWIYLLLQVIFIGYSAQVRPTLALYPIINLFILITVANENHITLDTKIYKLIIVSSTALTILCNVPSARNYINHGFFQPTDLIADGMFNQLGYNVLNSEGKLDVYNAMQNSLQNITDPSKKIDLEQELAIEIYRKYPLTTLAQMARNAIGIMGRAHWPLAANFWGYNFKDFYDGEVMSRQKSNFVLFIEVSFNLVYLYIYSLFFAFLIRIFRQKKFMFLWTIVLFIFYFLVPTFVISRAGSRMRLPVEGLIVLVSFAQLKCHYRS